MFKCISARGRGSLIICLCLLVFFSVTLFPKSIGVGAPPLKVPIIMYHSILKEADRLGPYVISPQILQEDMKYLKEKGYTAIFVRDLADAVTKGTQLPPKPIIITFDDGHLNNLTLALPILQKYDMKAVISVVGKFSEDYSNSDDHNPLYAYLTWDDIKALENTGMIEIANHSYDMHHSTPRHGTMMKKGESQEQYRKALLEDVGKTQKLLEENAGIVPTTFTYPFGRVSKESVAILKELGFTAFLTCNDRVNYISDEIGLINLGRFNRPYGISTYEFMKKSNID